MADSKIRISLDDLYSPHVDEQLKRQEATARTQQHYQQSVPDSPQITPSPVSSRQSSIWYNTVVYMIVFGLAAAVPSGLLWNVVFWNERDQEPNWLVVYFSEILVGLLFAVSLGVAESIVTRNPREFLRCFGIGIVVGLVAGLIFPFAAALLMVVVQHALVGDRRFDPRNDLVALMVARAAGWVVFGAIVAAVPGIALRSSKKIGLGLLGGAIGGFIGGLLFDPLSLVFDSAGISRLFGICAVGAFSGAGMGLVENIAKSGWLKVTAGLIAGKQFILYRNPTYIGSSPQCEIYLFKDPNIGPRHAAVHLVPGGFELQDLGSPTGTFVNGQSVGRTRLRNNDQIQIGSTCFAFQEKTASN